MAAPKRVALITGSSRGLGRAVAKRLARDGMAVAVNSRRCGGPLAQLVDEIQAEGGTAAAFAADVTDEAAVAELAASVERYLGPIDVLVLNATGPQPEAVVAEADWQAHLDQLAFFVRSPVLLGRALSPGMIKRGWGRIIHIDSELADRPPVGWSAYATAKNGQIGLARAWAHELAPHGVTVNTVAPGWIPVERHEGSQTDGYLATVPSGRMGTPEDVAHVVSFLASAGAGFVTGQRITVDGGRSLHV
ncbi:SDR family oxidoreductase [Catellatospora sp. KI3]|uniref:SDR family NAD(P)-dependent oxidoreductase n=1 Tax=Catellatospora sp. KI3 TaxID=3041620 RepID=UPI0024831DD4|nr:SDR family oxidoreductase [Catellatospora sp. KI3]MDI1461602.1 SDR family oxidoreductase [Catellatospora sp. KI3]